MVIGANPTDGHPVFGSRMKRRVREGAKLIVIDPRDIDIVNCAACRGHASPETAPRHQRRHDHRAGACDRDRRPGRRGLRRRTLRDAGLRRMARFRVRVRENSPEAMEAVTGVPAAEVRAAARLYATGGNARDLLRPRRDRTRAGLDHGDGHRQPRHGHRQRRPRRRGRESAARPEQCAGLLRHGLLPARVAGLPPCVRHRPRATCSRRPGASSIQPEPGLRIPNMFDAALDGSSRACTARAKTSSQSDPNTQHVQAALAAMECMVVQDLFLNETAKFAHVFLPGSSFLEKDGTFTNAERRISRVRKVMPPLAGKADWEVTVGLAKALGYPMHYDHPSQIMDEIARLTPTFTGVSYDKLDELGSIQWPCNDEAPEGTPTMHVDSFVRGKGHS